MTNLRLIHDNAADRATITASSTAGTLTTANLKSDAKSLVHRSVGKSVTYTLAWLGSEAIGGVALPATNLSADAQIRVRGYDAADLELFDTGQRWAAPGGGFETWDWTMPLNANAFAYGGVTKTALWLDDHYSVRRLVIDLSDPLSKADAIDCARIVAGGYWEPEYNPAYGAAVDVVDLTQNTRADSGDNVSDRGTQHDTMALDLAWLTPADRGRMQMILRGNGVARPVFIAALPGQSDPRMNQDWLIYGKRQNAGITYANFQLHATQITIEGW